MGYFIFLDLFYLYTEHFSIAYGLIYLEYLQMLSFVTRLTSDLLNASGTFAHVYTLWDKELSVLPLQNCSSPPPPTESNYVTDTFFKMEFICLILN